MSRKFLMQPLALPPSRMQRGCEKGRRDQFSIKFQKKTSRQRNKGLAQCTAIQLAGFCLTRIHSTYVTGGHCSRSKVSPHLRLNQGRKVRVGRKYGSELKYTGMAVNGSKLKNQEYRMQQGKSAGSCGYKRLRLKSWKILGRGVLLQLRDRSVIKNMVAAGHNWKYGSSKGTGTLAEWTAEGFSESTRSVDAVSRCVSSDPPQGASSGGRSARPPRRPSHIRAPHLTSALEVTFPLFPLCHTEQSCGQRMTKFSSLIWRETIQLMDFWEESSRGNIFLDLCVTLTSVAVADLPCSTKDNGWKRWLGGGECLPLLETACILMWNCMWSFL